MSRPPLLLHAHIPKTAGQSFIALLERNFPGAAKHLIFDDPATMMSLTELAAVLAREPHLRAISSHGVRVFPESVGGRQALTVTFLREPTATLLSLLRYARATFHEQSAIFRSHWPADTPDRSLRDLAVIQLAGLGRYGQFSPQTRFFCPTGVWSQPFGLAPNAYGFDALAVAKATLNRLFFVGVVEEFETALQVLAGKLQAVGVPFNVSEVPQVNASPKARQEEVAWLHPDDEVGGQVLRALACDRRLWLHAKARLAAEESSSRAEPSPAPAKGFARWTLRLARFGKTPRGAGVVPPSEATAVMEGGRDAVCRGFGTWEYGRLNARRLEHLATLPIPWRGKRVWEVSAGIGDLTSFFLDRGGEVTVSDVRPENLAMLEERFPFCTVARVDLEEETYPVEKFDVVFCYGALYHIATPEKALRKLAGHCRELLLLETCVTLGAGHDAKTLAEDASQPSQAFHGVGCRPSEAFVIEALRRDFAFVYRIVPPPEHEQFLRDASGSRPAADLHRGVFLAAHQEMPDERFVPAHV